MGCKKVADNTFSLTAASRFESLPGTKITIKLD